LYTNDLSPKQRSGRPVPTAVFLKSAASPAQFPPDTGREVAFVGRSNSGKSTAVNVITGAKKLARVSKTPGRTQLLNFFSCGEDRRLVDLPGYGFARVAPEVQASWRRSLEDYLSTRASLRGLVVTMDIRRGLTPLDEVLLRWLEPRDLPVAVLLTKADKLSRAAGMAQERALRKSLGPAVNLARFSALTGDGVAEARAWVEGWLSGPHK
jgi:GTP-binding protein